MTNLTIFALKAGSGLLALAALPGRGGDYCGDLDNIRKWKPDLVISMTPEVELASEGLHHLPQDLQEITPALLHLPVTDYGVPTNHVSAQWHAARESVHVALLNGGRVLVHCRGGCGRSGMMALRVLIEMGEPADTALKRLRLVRPCAVETEEQLRWACQAA